MYLQNYALCKNGKTKVRQNYRSNNPKFKTIFYRKLQNLKFHILFTANYIIYPSAGMA
jgi:hypothetical protein